MQQGFSCYSDQSFYLEPLFKTQGSKNLTFSFFTSSFCSIQPKS